MPAVPQGSLILVSGASGFIAVHLCSHLLMNGYRVRGTVRSTEKGEYLKKLFDGVGEFEYVIVEDIAKPGAFDDAVKGVDGIAHTASPFYLDAPTTDELIKPAVQGTVGIMESAFKNCPQLKRLVITSSVAAVIVPEPTGDRHKNGAPYTFTEEDWNTYSPGVIEKEGHEAPGADKYRASKTLAERAAWDFMEKNHPSWDFATINPPLVLGPVMHQVSSPESINTSVANFWGFTQGKKTDDDLKEAMGNWVDVRNVAEAHVLALTKPEAGGNRFIVSAGPLNGQDIVDIIHDFPGDKIPNVPVGQPGKGAEIRAKTNIHSGAKAEKDLGIKYVSLKVSVEDMYKSLQEKFDKSGSKESRTE